MRAGIGVMASIRGGPARYGVELVRALSRLDADLELTIFTDQPSALAPLTGGRISLVHVPLRRTWEQAWWDLKVALAMRGRKLDVYHGTKGILPPVECAPYVVTIHDLAVLRFPHTFSVLQRLHLRALLPRTVRLARAVLTDSEHSRADLCKAFPLVGPRLRVAPLAAASVFCVEPQGSDPATLERLGVRLPYLLYAGTVQPRKGVADLVRAFSLLRDRNPELTLVIAGRLRPDYRPSFVHSPPPGVNYLGEVTDEELAALYRHAVAFCSPSRYEGFGLSFLEAMQSGCPVLAPRAGSLPEVIGGAAYFFDLHVPSLADAIARVAGDSGLRRQLREAGLERARQFSWRKTAEATLEVYREVTRG